MESSVRYKPKFGRVVIKREVREKTSAGIIIPGDAAKRNANCEGVVVGLGETAGWSDTYDSEGNIKTIQTLKIGDKVIFGRHSGAWLDASYGSKGEQMDDGSLFICQDADILATIED